MVGSSGLQAEVRAGQADLGQAGADRRLPGDERRAAGGAALLAVPVGEVRTLLGDAVDVRGAIPHDAVVVRADVEPADVVAPDDQNVRLVGLRHVRLLTLCSHPNPKQPSTARLARGSPPARSGRSWAHAAAHDRPEARTTLDSSTDRAR